MLRRSAMVMLVIMGIIGGCWIAQGLSQQSDEEGRQRDRGRDRRQRIEDFRRRMQERMRERLGATEEEWAKVLYPRIEKIQTLQRQSRGGFGRWFRRRGRRSGEGQRPAGGEERQQSEVEKKTAALRSLLDDKASGAEAIKAALAALRQARAKVQQELLAARKELRGVVTVRQEAQLVLMSILD